jgi:NitT/TauT family transport system substrate-binding protein
MSPKICLPATLILLSLGVGGCREKPVPNGLFHVVLQTDWYPQPEMGGFYQAQLQGLYKAQGLDVEIVPGGPNVVAGQQVAAGTAQFGMGSSDSVLVDNARGVPEVAVGATMQQDPQAVMLHADSPVRRFEDLDGKSIAVKPGSIWFQYLVKRYNLTKTRETPATYSVANFLADPQYIQQAFVTSEPFFAAKAGAQVRTLLISSTEYQPYRVFFTSKDFLAEHPDVVKKFVSASIAGWKNYLADPAMVNDTLLRLNPAMSPEQTKFSIDTLKSGHFIDGTGTAGSHLGHFDDARWQTTYKQLLDLKVIQHPLDVSSVYTTRFIP